MKVKDLARLAVIKTNPHWPFSRLNKTPYYAAIKRFLKVIEKFPEIKSAYLRHGLLQKDWIPAISDIDITLISDSSMDLTQEFLFLRTFWNRFKKSKKLFPMLGEVDILTEDQTTFWTQFSIRGYEAKEWQLLHGAKTLKLSYNARPKSLSLDSMDHALLCYLNLFHRQMYRTNHHPQLKLPEMKRFSSKILRYVHYLDDYQTNGSPVPAKARVSDLLFTLLVNFDQKVQTLSANQYFEQTPGWSIQSRNSHEWGRLQEIDLLRLQELEPVKDVIESIVLSHNRDFVILKDVAHANQIEDLIDVIHRVFAPRNSRPLILTQRLFDYVIQFHDPFLYTHLLRCGKIAFGGDPMSAVLPPDLSSFVRCVLKEIPNVLSFTQSDTLFNLFESETFQERMLDSMVERALFIKLFLEKQWISPWQNEMLLATQEQYPEEQQKILKIKNMYGAQSTEAASFELFRYWKEITNSISTLLSRNLETESFLERSFMNT